MLLSKLFIPITKDLPTEAKIKSHQLMLRTGMIRQSSAGIYSWLPLGFKVMKKIEKISLDNEVIVLVDGDRESIYSNYSERDKGKISNRWFNTIILNLEDHQSIKLVNMHPIFLDDWQLNRKKFNSEYDSHWNEYGHSLIAKTLTLILEEKQNKK